ncbi:hypothetical protein C8T65DRAFT_828390 [Cerioporus squamosus]|nr:hypothetical protein C8T65DRAFT_828390 [Cerioporus squamosus]
MPFTIFLSRRCWRKLRARVNQGTTRWTKHPLELLHSWYHDPKTVKPASKQFRVPSYLRALLAKYELLPDGDGVPSKNLLTYTISQDTAISCVDMLYDFLQTMLKMYRRTDTEWEPADTNTLYVTLLILHRYRRDGAQSRPATLGEAIMNLSGHHATASQAEATTPPAATAASAATSAAEVDDKHEGGSHEKGDDEDNTWVDSVDEVPEDIPLTGETVRATVVRYLQTLCIPYAAAEFYVLYGLRTAERHGASGIRLQAYTVSSTPSVPHISAATVHEFAHKFVEHFPFPGVHRDVLTSACKTLARPLARGPLEASEHAEATLMGLACSSRSDAGIVGRGLQTTAAQTVESMFQASRVPVGVSKKCCFCCHKLATLLQERDALEFVLEGTHSVIVPWVPPQGIPAEVLVD